MPVLGLSHFNLRAPLPLLDKLRDFYVTLSDSALGFARPFSVSVTGYMQGTLTFAPDRS